MYKVILSLGKGNLSNGCPVLSVQLWDAQRHLVMKSEGSLPPNPKLENLYRDWRSLYRAYYQNIGWSVRMEIDDQEVNGVRFSPVEFSRTCDRLSKELNNWFSSAGSFQSIEQQLYKHLHPSEEIQVIIETEDEQLRRFPWHLWNFFENYPHGEIALSLPKYEQVVSSHKEGSKAVKILGILGNCTKVNGEKIDVQTDKTLIEQLPGAQPKFLVEPSRQELNAQFWEEDWDILFFAGHSASEAEGKTGRLHINQHSQNNSITVDELANALRHGIERGLKLAIFNSCDSLGLAWDLAKLNIPQTIAMRESVPDEVAQAFLQYFLQAFSSGQSFYLAVRKARERLQGLEAQFPCASWLPAICQNPAVEALTWQGLLQKPEPSPQPPQQRSWRHPLLTGLLTSLVVTGLVVGGRSLGLFQASELGAFDWLMRLRPQEEQDDFDFEPNLAAQLQSNEDFIAVCEIGQTDDRPFTIPAPPGIPAERLGYTDFPRDPDDVIRRQLLLTQSTPSCQTSQSLSLRVALNYLGQAGISPMRRTAQGNLQIGDLVLRRLESDAGGYQLPSADALGYQILLNYRSSNFPQVSLRDLINNSMDSQLPDLVKDRIVLIGVADGSRDLHLTPYSWGVWPGKMPGVIIHAQAIAQIISAVQQQRPLLWWWSQWGEVLWIGSWSLIGGLLAWCARKPLYLGLAIFTALILLFGLCFLLLLQGGWLPLVPSALALVATSGCAIVGFKLRKGINYLV